MYQARPHQLLSTHEQECARTMSTLLAPIGLPQLGALIGGMHDFGKMSADFQEYIEFLTQNLTPPIQKGGIDHSTAGAQFVWNYFPVVPEAEEFFVFRQIIALCIASHHHSSLIDCFRGTMSGDDVFSQRMEKSREKTHLDEILSKLTSPEKNHYSSLLENPELVKELKNIHTRILSLFGHSPKKVSFHYGLIARFCLSSLIEADYTSASGRGSHDSIPKPDWGGMQNNLNKHLGSFKAETPINQSRAAMSQECFQAAGGRVGKWSLTLPTGAGKTLSSLRFALEHARQHHLSRIIYVIPYTSILDQTANSIKEALGDEYNECILEHHSNLVQETLNKTGEEEPWTPEKKTWYMEATQTWNVPIVLTTVVQYLNALYASGKQHIRRMHSLANAVVIFDEVQAIPLTSLRLFEHSLDFLSGICHSSAIRCTATPPEAPTETDAHDRLVETPIIPDSQAFFDQFNQFRQCEVYSEIKSSNYWTVERMRNFIMEQASANGPTLVIVNTKSLAAKLASDCRNLHAEAHILHLSTNMCPAHRKEIITNHIDKASLQKARTMGKTVVCISTGLIEAGVDVDFDVIIRSVAGLDSCMQAAGRCNRDASRPGGKIILINPVDKLEELSSLPELEIGKEIAMDMIRDPEEEEILGNKSVALYFKEFHGKLPRTHNHDHLSYPFPCSGLSTNMEDALSLNFKLMSLPRQQPKYGSLRLFQAFASAAHQYHPIQEDTTAVLTSYGEGEKYQRILWDMNPHTEEEWQQWNDCLQKSRAYSVPISNQNLGKYLNAGEIMRIQEGMDIYTVNADKYDPFLGFLAHPGDTCGALTLSQP